MAAPRVPLHLVMPVWNQGTRGLHGLSKAVAPEGSQKGKSLLQFLADRFYDVQTVREHLFRKRVLKVHQKNRLVMWLLCNFAARSGDHYLLWCPALNTQPLTYIKERFGPHIAGAYFILKLGGAVKFQGKEWIRPNMRGHFSLDFLKFPAVTVEAIDASGSAINYQGLDNLLALKELRSLWLQRCPHVDDWCLSRLHPLANSLQELSLAGCPRISERGLACLHHLQNLCRLDISDLPAVSNPGFTRILVEEMLPSCEVLGADWAQGLKLGPEEQSRDLGSPIPA